MALLKRILLVVVALAVLLVVGAFFVPRQSHVERSISIGAPRANIFAIVNGYKRFNEWSPWYARDPNAKYTYSGPSTGVGAAMSWVGNSSIGSGSQKIVESKAEEMTRTDLVFNDGPAEARMLLAPEGTGTKVTWTLDVDAGYNPAGRYMGLLMNRLVGPDFELGLRQLKAVAEKGPTLDVAGLKAEIAQVASAPVAFVEGSAANDPAAIVAAIGAGHSQVKMFMSGQGVKQTAPPLVIDKSWDNGQYAFDAAIPLDRLPSEPVPADSPVKLKGTYAGTVAKAVHQGPYGALQQVRLKLAAWAQLNGYQPVGPTWVEFVSDPGTTQESALVTNVYLGVK